MEQKFLLHFWVVGYKIGAQLFVPTVAEKDYAASLVVRKVLHLLKLYTIRNEHFIYLLYLWKQSNTFGIFCLSAPVLLPVLPGGLLQPF